MLVSRALLLCSTLVSFCSEATRSQPSKMENPWDGYPIEKKYYVFVKKYELGGNFYTLKLAWHTETMFCPVKGPEFIQSAVDEALGDLKLTKESEGTFTTPDVVVPQDMVDTLSPHFDDCFVTGYAGIGPRVADFHSTEAFFFHGNHGDQNLIYVGNKELSLKNFLDNMISCGTWNSMFYHLLYHNCNYYTATLMKALSFRSPTFQVEKVLGGAWIPDNGYWSVDQNECRGVKCTGQPFRDGKNVWSGVCDQGRCWDEGSYNPETHSCSSKPSSPITPNIEDTSDEAELNSWWGEHD